MRSAFGAALVAAAAALVAVTPAPAAAQDAQDSPVVFWASLGDPVLEQLVTRALTANHTVRSAGARVRAARATRTGAALELTPSITATGGYSRQRLASTGFGGGATPFGDQDVWDAGVQMAWELDLFGRGRGALRGRNALLGAAEGDVADARVLVAAEVARAYYELRGAEDRLAVAQRNAANQRGTLQVTLDRLEAGQGTALDSERAQVQLSATLAAIPELETAIAAARYRLATLAGVPADSLAVAASAAPGTLPVLPPAPAVTGSLLHLRPDVQSAERRFAASTAFTSAARAEYLPRVSIGGVAGYTSNAFESIGGTGTSRYAVGPVISWPLFDLGRVKANVDAARAAESEAAVEYERAVLRAAEETGTALVAYAKARERLQHLEDAAAASERATELARLRYEEGATGFLEVLDAERTQLEAQDRLAAGRTGAMAGLVAVYRAVGGRWQPQ